MTAPIPSALSWVPPVVSTWREERRQPLERSLLAPALFPGALSSNLVAVGLPRTRVAAAPARVRTVIGIGNAMALTNDLTPPIDADGEIETVTFDYGQILASGVTIVGIVSIGCAVYRGTDATPSARLIGSPAIAASPRTGAASAAILQLVGAMLAGVTYRLQCTVNTSDGQRLSLWTHLACQAPT